jgi:hypothetical protein
MMDVLSNVFQAYPSSFLHVFRLFAKRGCNTLETVLCRWPGDRGPGSSNGTVTPRRLKSIGEAWPLSFVLSVNASIPGFKMHCPSRARSHVIDVAAHGARL